MKLLEKILAGLIVFGLLLKLFLIISGATFFVLSISALACIYYPFGFAFLNNIRLRKIFKKYSYTGISTMRILGAIVAGMTFAIILTGIEFKLM